MKNIILLIILFSSLGCKAQDTIKSNELTVNGIITIGKNESILVENFGNPIEIEKSFSEMDNVDMFIYKYNGIVFYVKNGIIDDFEITNSNYKLTKHNIKPGDKIDNLKNIFPLSYNEKVDGILSLNLNDYDKYLNIYFNKKTYLITKIFIGTY